MESITVDETFLTGSEALTSLIDEKTLACSPAPVAASTVLREKCMTRPRVISDYGASFLDNRSLTPEEQADDRSSEDRSSLGLLPSNCLLDQENDLLCLGSVSLPRNPLQADPPAASHSSTNSSHKNQLLDSLSSREHTSDSHEFLTTVKKCPQGTGTVKGGGRFAPQALFAEVDELRLDDSTAAGTYSKEQHQEMWDTNEAQQNTDSGMGQTNTSHSHRSNEAASNLGVQNSNLSGECDGGKLLQGQNQHEEADHTIHQVELEEEDLEELEEVFSEFEGSSDEEKCDKLASDDPQTRKHSTCTDLMGKHLKPSSQTVNNLFPSMDGLFKIPLPPLKSTVTNKLTFGTPGFSSTAISSKHPEVSLIFGDSIQFHQSESSIDWGPSIDFGSSTHIEELLFADKDRQPTDQATKKNTSIDDTNFFQEPAFKNKPEQIPKSISHKFVGQGNHISQPDQWLVPPCGELADVKDSRSGEESVGNVNPFGDFPDGDLQADDNPFKDIAGTEVSFPGFGDEDFLVDTEAAAALLAEDEQIHRQENLVSDELFNSTIGSVRGEDQTFMNMTIGTYMAAGSGELGSLASRDRRPEFGMPVKSPPAVRPAVPILSPDKTFSPSNENNTQHMSVDHFKHLNNVPLMLDKNTNADVTSGKRSSQQTKNQSGQDESHVQSLGPLSESSLQKLEQSDFVKNSFPAESFNTASKVLKTQDSYTCAEISSQKVITGQFRINSSSKDFAPATTTTGQSAEVSQSTSKANSYIDLETSAQIVVTGQTKTPSSNKDLVPVSVTSSQQHLLVAESEATLGHLNVSVDSPENDSINSTAGEITLSNIYKLIDRSDFSLADAGQLILSEYDKMVQRKQEAKQSKCNVNKILAEKGGQGIGIKPASTSEQFQASSKFARKESRIPQSQRKADNIPIQTPTVQKSTDISKSANQNSQIQIETALATATISSASTDIPKPEVKSSINQAHSSQTTVRKIVQTDRVLPKPVAPTSQSKSDVIQTSETDKRVSPKLVAHISQSKKEGIQPFDAGKKDLSKPQADFSQINSSDKKTLSKNNGKEVAVATIRYNSTIDRDCLSANGISASMTNKKAIGPPESAHKAIHPEMSGNQQKCFAKGSEHQTTSSLLQSQLTMFSADDQSTEGDYTLESVTINSQHSLSTKRNINALPYFETSSVQPTILKEKINQLSVVKPQKNAPLPHENLHHLLNRTTDNSVQGDISDAAQFHSLMLDDTNSTIQNTLMGDRFVSSTPLYTQGSGVQMFTNNTLVAEKTILPMITPKVAFRILDMPEVVNIPDVCCVHLSQQTNFTITNLLDKGVKCLLTIREVQFRGQRINPNLCPFELKRQFILSQHSSQEVQVIFRPKDQGEFMTAVEIFSKNLTNPQENRTYVLHICGYAEFPSLKISPANDDLDFGDLLWGRTSCRSVRIQNVGRATIPIRFSIFRKESSLCNFSFYPENITDVSAISLTTRSPAVDTVCSMSLPGTKKGQQVTTETVKIYCRTKEPQNSSQRYLDKAEIFHAVLSIGVDMPVEEIRPLNETKLHVTVGMYKLHVNQETLFIKTLPGKMGQGTIKIINSGNIPMHVAISFEPHRENFSLSTDHVVVPSGDSCPIHVTFTPQPIRENQDDNKVNLMLKNEITQHFISVIGQVQTTQTKVCGSTTAVNFGGVSLGQNLKQKFSFTADNDDDVRIWIRNPGSAFKLLVEDGAFVENLELSAVKGKQYTVWILFSPSEVKGYSADLMVQILYASRYAIPISGYGGCSKLVIEGVDEPPGGGKWLDLSYLDLGTSVIRKITARNIGDRCCFIKAMFYDVSRQEYQPFRATVMPSAVILPPHEATDLLLMLNPSQKEVDLCKFGRALVAIIKITYSDEITRQHFLNNPGKQPRRLINDFDIPLTSTQREIVDLELKSVVPPMDSYSTLKKSLSEVKIGLLGDPLENQPAMSKISSVEADTNRLLSQHRQALSPVNPNVNIRKDEWTVAPSEIQLSVGGSRVKDFFQIINFSTNELQFSIQLDEGISAVPASSTVKPKDTTMVTIWGDMAHFSRKEPVARCGLVKVNCLHQVKYVKVYVPVTSGQMMSPKSTMSATMEKPASLPTTMSAVQSNPPRSMDHVGGPSSRPLSLPSSDCFSQSSSLSPKAREAGAMKIQGSDMSIFPATEAGTKKDQTYFFTNIGTGPLVWELAPFAPPYVKYADTTQNLYRVNYDVFKLSPLTGVLQPDDTEKVTIEFLPQSKGSYNQAWCIHDTADGQSSSHRFTVYAKASPSPSLVRGPTEEGNVPQGLSSTHVSTHVSTSIDNHSHNRLLSHNTELLTAPRDTALTGPTVETSRPLVKGSDANHQGEAAKKTRQQSSSMQNPATTLNPGISWSPVLKSDVGLSHARSTLDQMMRNPQTSRHTAIEAKTSAASRKSDAAGEASSWQPNSAKQNPVNTINPVVSGSLVPLADMSHARITLNHMMRNPPNSRGTASEASTPGQSSSSQHSSTSSDNSSSRSDRGKGPDFKCLHLVHDVIEFPKLHPGESTVLKLHLKNPTSEDTQVVVECEPKPPFLVKHYNFRIGRDKMVMFPVTFKPRHVAKFKDKVIFKEISTGKSITATLEAECVNKLATVP